MEKYKVIISPDPLPEQEIEAHKDFEQLLKNHQVAVHTKYWWQAGISALSVAGLVGVWLYLTPGLGSDPNTERQITRQEVRQEQMVEVAPAAEATAPVYPESGSEPLTPAGPAVSGVPAVSAPAFAKVKDAPESATLPAPSLAKAPTEKPATEALIATQPDASGAQTELALFTQPEPTVGFKGLQEFFAKQMQRPAGTEGLQGTVLVSFVINEQGQPEDIEIEKSLQETLDAEALRLVRLMPPWKPATANGKPVNTRIAVPVRF